jgi:anthranilate synthase/aminodeoxychorismate synthase-like glutamine amidotransferase
MHILIIDNYDSFTYNLVQYVKESHLAEKVTVLRNDAFELAELAIYDAFILSPGPGLPEESGLLLEVIKTYANQKPMLGICLGHQAIAEAFGGKLKQLEKVYHGVATAVSHSGNPVFAGQASSFMVGRYHSWVVEDLGSDLEVTAVDEQDAIMACEHKSLPIYGLQFHPESVLTPEGRGLMDNFLKIARNVLTAEV